MSGIYIPNMKMPTYCDACPFCVFTLCLINTLQEGKYCVTHSCPLVAVPDHHDLIDINDLKLALMDIKFEGNASKDLAAVFREINLAKTIIPADKDGE